MFPLVVRRLSRHLIDGFRIRQVSRAERAFVNVRAVVIQEAIAGRMHVRIAAFADAPRCSSARIKHIHAPAWIANGEARVDEMPSIRRPARRVGALSLRRDAATAAR